jgi:nucleotide-binding universal stress UspA family protein
MTREEDLVAPLARRWRKVLCAVDFSECSRDALAIAADIARRLDAPLTIVHVRDDSAARGPGTDDRELERELSRFKLYASEYVDGPVQTKLLVGPPASEIVGFARYGGFDLVVTGTHGRSGVKRLVLGSVAERVLRNAPCPVLVTRDLRVRPRMGRSSSAT